MTNQVNQEFEKWWYGTDANLILRSRNSAEAGYQACTQASESEINSLKQRVHEVEARALEESNKYVEYCNLAEAKIAELTASNNQLHEALERMVESYQYEASSENESLLNAFKVLESTTAQSLAEHDNATIDRCKNIVADDALAITFQSMGAYRSAIIKQIGELKATP